MTQRRLTFQLAPLVDLLLIVIFAQYMEVQQSAADGRAEMDRKRESLQAEAQEQARAEQALTDWQRLGQAGDPPSDLVLRKPQLQAARARVASARSALAKARLDLERTTIVAPFSGRVLRQVVQ